MLGHRKNLCAVILLAAAVAACGGKKGDAKASGEAEVKVPAVDQLRGISVGLQQQLGALMAPINEVDQLIAYVTGMPQRLGVSASALLGSAKATMDSGQVQISADLTADAAIRAEVEGVIVRLKAITDGLKAIPQNAQALAGQAAQALVAVPALGMKAQSELTLKASNPFAKPEEKAQAQADLQSLAQIQADVQGTIQQVQQQVMGLPAMATGALAKLAAAFAS